MLLFLFAFLSISFSFLCSVWEAVLLSIPSAHVEILLSEKHPIANNLKKLKSNIDQPLSAILSLNTIAHTVGAIGVGAVADETFGSGNVKIAGTEMPFSAEAVVAVVMTLAILILSEIIPKTIGATFWKRLTPFTVRSMNIVMMIMKPFVLMSQFITKKIKASSHEQAVTRADFSAMASIGQKDGVFDAGESKIIKNLMRFNEIEARSIMTPRTVVKAASEDLTIETFYKENPILPFSRIPIYQKAKDSVTGFVLKDVLLEAIIKGNGSKTLKDVSRPIIMVEENQKMQDLFNQLLSKNEHIAVVVDQYGGMAGILTVEDIIETLLGLEIVDELDSIEDMQQLARENWEKRAKRMGLIDEKSEPK